MPTYEYACRSCGHTFEIVQSMSDEPLTECPECHGELRKVFAPPAIAFKGSGFYATDHGKKAKKADASPDKSEGKGAKGDSAKKPEGGSSSSGSKEGSTSGTTTSGGSGSSKKEATSS